MGTRPGEQGKEIIMQYRQLSFSSGRRDSIRQEAQATYAPATVWAAPASPACGP